MSNKILRLVTLVIITLLIIIYAFNDTVLEDGVTVYDADHETWTDQLVTGDSYEVSMIPSKTIEVGLKGVMIPFVTYGNNYHAGTLQVVVSGEKGTIVSRELNVQEIREWRWEHIRFDKKYKCKPGEELRIVVKAINIPEGTTLSIAKSKSGNLAIQMNQTNLDQFEKLFILFSVALIFIIGGAYFSLVVKKVPLEYVFIYTVVPVIIMVSILIPPLSGPDEGAHISEAYWIADTSENGGVNITDSEINTGLREEAADHEFYARYLESLTSRTMSAKTVEIGGFRLKENPMILYFMNGMGLKLGRAMHLSGAGIIMCARMMGMLPILVLLFYAIKRAIVAKTGFFVLCTFPMIEMLSGVVNPDGIIIALSLALASCTIHQALNNDAYTVLDYLDFAVIAIGSVLLSTAKFGALIPICLLPLLMARGYQKGNRKNLIITAGSILLPVICVVGIWLPFLSRTMNEKRGGDGLWSRYYSVSDVVHHPFRAFIVFMNTIWQDATQYFTGAVGDRLGSLDARIPPIFVIAIFVLLLFALVPSKNDQVVPHGKRWFLAGVGLLGTLCAMGGMLVGWTGIGEDKIFGIQGRYFIPFIMPVLIAITPEHIRADKEGVFHGKIAFAAVWMQMLIIMALFVRA